jgi:hypothetical protein
VRRLVFLIGFAIVKNPFFVRFVFVPRLIVRAGRLAGAFCFSSGRIKRPAAPRLIARRLIVRRFLCTGLIAIISIGICKITSILFF